MTELSLPAALRDVDAKNPETRNLAIRCLAPALLDALALQPPAWWEHTEHPQRAEIIAALERGCADEAPQNAALARIGLAELSAPNALPRARELLAVPGDDDADMFSRECGVICLSLLGAAARDYLARPDSASDRSNAEQLRREVLDELRELLGSAHADVRFQVGPALVEVGEGSVEAELVAAFASEAHEQVRANLVAALSLLDPPGPAACDVLAKVLEGPEGGGDVGWEAAMALTSARRSEGGLRLVAGLRARDSRDRALEALAVLGSSAPPEATKAIERYSTGFMVPIFTRVRAAYALARIDPPVGEALLTRYAKHPRPAVREAVAEARTNLAKLEAPQNPRSDDRYRSE